MRPVASTGTLAWLGGILWPVPQGVETGPSGHVPKGFRVVDRYGVLPGGSNPRLLVPLSSPRAAAASLRQWNNSMSQAGRLRKWLASAGLRTGLPQRLMRDRVTVVAPAGFRPVLEEYLRKALGRSDLRIAVMPGRVHRPNRKPVLALVAEDGEVAGYAKVGWNGVTRSLVRNEARVLRAWSRRPPVSFAVPRLLHQGTCGDLDLLITDPAPSRVWRRSSRNAFPPSRTLVEVGALGGTETVALGESGFWHRVRRRASLSSAPAPTGRRLLEAVERIQSEAGGVPMSFGTWHGDWAPWNMEWADGHLFVWDWERCRDGVPFGLDVVHFWFQTALRRSNAADSLAHSLRSTGSSLERVGVDRRLTHVLHRIYLVELLLRLAEGESALDPSVTDAWAAELLGALETLPGLNHADRPSLMGVPPP